MLDLAQIQREVDEERFADAAEIQREIDEVSLKKAIRTQDYRTMAECLRRLAGGQISPDIINKLADYLDPAIENPLYTCGPKPKKKRLFVERYLVVNLYKILCENKVLPTKKEIKLLVCNMYGMKGTRTFETWLAEYNKK